MAAIFPTGAEIASLYAANRFAEVFMFRLLKLAVFALVGYAIYELYLGMTEEYGDEHYRERVGSSRARMTGGGEGMQTETVDESGAEVPRTVGRGVVS
jgi:hypothetical protein